MFFVFIDEAYAEPNTADDRDSRFLVVSSTLIEAERALGLTEEIEEIRARYGFKNTDSLKFSPSDRPPEVTREQHIDAKRDVFRAAADHNVRVILYSALHKIVDTQGMDTYMDWAIDATLTKVEQFSREEVNNRPYMCYVDRHSRPEFHRYLKRKFQHRANQTREGFNTTGLLGTAMVWDGTSHLASVCDIVTGSYNFALNFPDNDRVGPELMQLIRPLLWSGQPHSDREGVKERSILFRPNEIRISRYARITEESERRILHWAGFEQA